MFLAGQSRMLVYDNTAFQFTKVVKIIHMVYSTFNQKLFYGEDISFCLISNANTMDVYMFHYGTILYAVMLVIAYSIVP